MSMSKDSILSSNAMTPNQQNGVPDFPLRGFVTILWVRRNGRAYPLPGSAIMPSLERVSHYAREYKDELVKQIPDARVSDLCFVIPLRFARSVPLKKASGIRRRPGENRFADRVVAFFPLLEKPHLAPFYQMLVTPTSWRHRGRMVSTDVDAPMLRSTRDDDLRVLLAMVDHPVVRQAKIAARYDCDPTIVFDWTHGVVVEQDEREYVIIHRHSIHDRRV